jgi:nucleotide-binding universal stress UspA family protein
MFRHILIATDGSDLAQKATTNGISLAKSVGASVTAVRVFAPFQAYGLLSSAVMNDLAEAYMQYVEDLKTDDILDDVTKLASERGVRCRVMPVEQQHPHEGIIKVAAEQNCDLIVMASHGRSGIAAALLGSVTAKVLAHATIPVLVYH